MYDMGEDPYCYKGTTILKNIPNIRDAAALEAFETVSSAQRADEPLPEGRLSAQHYCAIHRHLFRDVYRWAGRYRVSRISKGDATFCYPEHIPREMRKLFRALKARNFLRELPRDDFAAGAAHFLAELNAIHPFREGNGRTQLSFMSVLTARAGHSLNLARLRPRRFLAAMIKSFRGDETPLTAELLDLLRDRSRPAPERRP